MRETLLLKRDGFWCLTDLRYAVEDKKEVSVFMGHLAGKEALYRQLGKKIDGLTVRVRSMRSSMRF